MNRPQPVFASMLLALTLAISVTSAAAVNDPGRIEHLKPLYPRTTLVAAGESRTRIVVPTGSEWAAVAAQLATAIEQATGARPAIVTDIEIVSDDWAQLAAGPRTDALIALGTIGTNRLLAYLWAEGYTAEDDGFPGKGGWVIRSIHDPFATGLNVLALGGSTPADVAAAIPALLPQVGRLENAADSPRWGLSAPVLLVHRGAPPEPYFGAEGAPRPAKLYRYDSPEEFARTLDQRVAAVRSRDQDEAKAKIPTFVSVTTVMAELADAWFHTGDMAYARLLKQLVDRHRDLIAVIPERVEMEPASAASMAWWDQVEELPVWTDADRLMLANAFLADARQGHEHTPAHELVREGIVQVVTENHGTASVTHTYDHWRYFSKYYDLPDEAYWLSVVRAVFAGQLASHQILEDASLYTPFVIGHSIDYALKSHDMRYLTSGIADTQLDFLMRAAYSNLGYSSGFGDSRFIETRWLWTPVARSIVFTHDPVAQWWWRHYLPVEAGINPFDADTPLLDNVPLEAPRDDWTLEPGNGNGVEVVPVYRQALGFAKESKELVTTPKEPAGDEWFNKVIFRDRWSPDAQYLLLDGFASWNTRPGEPPGPKGHNQNDINSIITFTAESRMWLIDHTYALRAVQDHNSLTITRDGVMTFENHAAQLHERAGGPELGLSRSTFDDYSGSTWERTIFWNRGKHFMVLDRVIADEPGEFTVRAAWRGLGEHVLQGDELRLEQSGRFGQVRSDGTAGLGVTPVPMPDAGSWKVYPHAKPIAKVFDQLQSATLAKGEAMAFANLLKASADPSSLDATQVRRLDASRVVVRDGDLTMLYGVGAVAGGWADTKSYSIGRDNLLLAGVTSVANGEVSANQPFNLSVTAKGEVIVEFLHDTALTVAGVERPVRSGLHALPDSEALAKDLLRRARADWAAAVDQPALDRADRAASSATRGAAQLRLPVRDVKQLREVKLREDEAPVWLVTGADGVTAFDLAGKQLWQFLPGAACGALAVADVDSDGAAEVIVGSDDQRVYLLDAAGRERWHYDCEATLGGDPPVPDEIYVVDLDQNGGRDIVVAANFVHVLQPDGSVRWEDYWRFQRNRKVGDVHALDFADIDGDGRLDIAAGIRLNYSVALAWNSDGKRIYPRDPAGQPDHKPLRVHLPNDVLTLDLFADGGPPQLVVAANDELSLRWTGGDRDTLSGGDFSGGVVALSAVRKKAGRPLVVAATDMGALFAYRATGDRKDGLKIGWETAWRQILGDPIMVLNQETAGDRPWILAGTRNGAARAVDSFDGQTRLRLPATGMPVVAAWVARGEFWVAQADGLVRHLPLNVKTP